MRKIRHSSLAKADVSPRSASIRRYDIPSNSAFHCLDGYRRGPVFRFATIHGLPNTLRHDRPLRVVHVVKAVENPRWELLAPSDCCLPVCQAPHRVAMRRPTHDILAPMPAATSHKKLHRRVLRRKIGLWATCYRNRPRLDR